MRTVLEVIMYQDVLETVCARCAVHCLTHSPNNVIAVNDLVQLGSVREAPASLR